MAGHSMDRINDSRDKPAKTGAGDSIKQIKSLGGQFGEALAEPLARLDKQVGELATRAESVESGNASLVKRIDQITALVASSGETSTSAFQLATAANEASKNAAQTASDALSKAGTEAQSAKDFTTGVKDTIERQMAELMGEFKVLGAAVKTFSREATDASDAAKKASTDVEAIRNSLEAAKDLLASAGKLVEEFQSINNNLISEQAEGLSSVKKEVEAVKTSIAPSSPVQNGRPTPRGGEIDPPVEAALLAGLDASKEERKKELAAGQEALKQIALLRLDLRDMHMAMRQAFTELDNRLLLLGLKTRMDDEVVAMLETPSFTYPLKDTNNKANG